MFLLVLFALFLSAINARLTARPQFPPLSPAFPAPLSLQNHYAVLVAGSSGFENYRHQADVCSTVSLLSFLGVPRSNIIVFVVDVRREKYTQTRLKPQRISTYSLPSLSPFSLSFLKDIVDSPDNPYPHQLFNFPTPIGVPGFDVYPGCVDENTYTKENVTISNFLAVMTGNASAATGPVLTSNTHSRVFLNLVDHGGTGVFCFPNELLTAQDLNQSLATAYDRGLFGELVIYLESCESGSMFNEILPNNSLPIYAATGKPLFL